MKRVNWLYSDVYTYPVLVYVGTWAQFRAHMKRHYKLDLGPQTHGGGMHQVIENEEKVGSVVSLIWLPRWDPKNFEDVLTLTHELLHASMAILNCVGIEFSFEHQEALCYLHEDLVRQASKKLN